MKNRLVLTVLIVVLFISFVYSEGEENIDQTTSENESLFSPLDASCFPNYVCEDWEECFGGIKARTCHDLACNRKEIIERQFCEGKLNNCVTDIKCEDWGTCIYTEKIEEIIKGKITFGGYQTRNCVDYNECTDNFVEEKSCGESYDLDVRVVEICGRNFLVATDLSSTREVAKIDVDSWKSKKLDILFSTVETKYCPTCYNGQKDQNEEEIDCGGDCKTCKKENQTPINLIKIVLWSFSLMFFVLSGTDMYPRIKSKIDAYNLYRLRSSKENYNRKIN